jgi:thiol-disulfide isomerase/thioredoxin
MKKALILIFVLTIIVSCKKTNEENSTNQSETNLEKKLFADIVSLLTKYEEDSKAYWEKGEKENARKYSDSIKFQILNSYIQEHEFESVYNTKYNTVKRKKPLFIQATASWCAPCKFEVPALNRIVEKYSNEVDFVLLFWDTKLELEKFASDYDNRIFLIPSKEEPSDGSSVSISGFTHKIGFPTNYLVTEDNQIINFSQGAMVPSNYIDSEGNQNIVTKEEADKGNFELLESQIKELLEKNATFTKDVDS